MGFGVKRYVEKAYCSPYSSLISLCYLFCPPNASNLPLLVYTVLYTMGPFTASFSYSLPLSKHKTRCFWLPPDTHISCVPLTYSSQNELKHAH